MFAVVLILLALVGGSAATYYIMDGPRRRGLERLAEIDQDRQELDDERARFAEEDQQLRGRKRELAATVAAHEQRAQSLTAREAEFNRRAITYNDLAAENRLLRTDLKNAVVHTAYLEQLHHANRSGATTASEQRDQLGRAYFDEVVAVAKKTLTPNNYPTVKQRVRTAAQRVRGSGADLPPTEEDQALSELHQLFERAVRVSTEREEQARLREQMREEQARQREIEEAEAAAERAERERVAAELALEKALETAVERAVADVAGKHSAEVESLRARLAEAEAKAERTKSLAQQTKAGHVYVISNIGSFGPGVFKIGMTRRLVPQHRVDELGDASVPFPFDVHMMIRCDNAPRLEAALHQRFRAFRVNRVNLRKEFFRATIEEIAAAVRDNHGEVEYTVDAEAMEYMNSQSATDADVEEIEGAHVKAEAPVLPVPAAGV
jgi:hypothetical protein